MRNILPPALAFVVGCLAMMPPEAAAQVPRHLPQQIQAPPTAPDSPAPPPRSCRPPPPAPTS